MERNDTSVVEIKASLDTFKPSEVVRELDHYIVGQEKAKKLVAIALRNRIRRKFVAEDLREEISPKNILMIGPTGVGKTEIARRMAQILDAPFIKVEATKFTERGYVGRDVEYMIRSLVNHSVNMVKSRMRESVKNDVYPDVFKVIQKNLIDELQRSGEVEESVLTPAAKTRFRNEIRKKLKNGDFDNTLIHVKLRKKNVQMFPMADMFPGMDDMENNFQSIFNDIGIETEEVRRMTVKEATEALVQQYLDDRIDKDKAVETGIRWAQEMGIVFIDEIDKISDKAKGNGPEISREGVQRDLLPIVEGTTVSTKYGPVRTDHILFVAAGAFHVSKPTDLIPELQGRFPIRVELAPLGEADLVRILTEPRSALAAQYRALLGTEGVELTFTDDAIAELARFAAHVNDTTENIGARRLATILETVLDEISFEAGGVSPFAVTVDAAYVRRRIEPFVKSQDLSRFIL